MKRAICAGVLALLLFSPTAFPQTNAAQRRPAKVILVQHFHRPGFLPSVAPEPLPYPVPYATTQYSVPILLPASPTYLLLGSASTIRPQLVFKDGTSYAVSDYWRVDDQLHFITLEEGGTKSVPHTVPFDTLDEPRTREAAAVQGFRFVLRDEPLDQWLQHHPQREKRRAGTGEKS